MEFDTLWYIHIFISKRNRYTSKCRTICDAKSKNSNLNGKKSFFFHKINSYGVWLLLEITFQNWVVVVISIVRMIRRNNLSLSSTQCQNAEIEWQTVQKWLVEFSGTARIELRWTCALEWIQLLTRVEHEGKQSHSTTASLLKRSFSARNKQPNFCVPQMFIVLVPKI